MMLYFWWTNSLMDPGVVLNHKILSCCLDWTHNVTLLTLDVRTTVLGSSIILGISNLQERPRSLSVVVVCKHATVPAKLPPASWSVANKLWMSMPTSQGLQTAPWSFTPMPTSQGTITSTHLLYINTEIRRYQLPWAFKILILRTYDWWLLLT